MIDICAVRNELNEITVEASSFHCIYHFRHCLERTGLFLPQDRRENYSEAEDVGLFVPTFTGQNLRRSVTKVIDQTSAQHTLSELNGPLQVKESANTSKDFTDQVQNISKSE